MQESVDKAVSWCPGGCARLLETTNVFSRMDTLKKSVRANLG
jgi:hypothetical protein